MSETTGPSVSRYSFSVAYAGEGRDDNHSVDVETLGPALVGFGKLIREANTQINRKNSKAKVLVVSDFEHKCFNINFEAVVSLYEQIKTLIDADVAVTAKSVLEWLGLLGLGSGGTVTYLEYLKWKRGRKVVDVQEIKDQDRSGTVTVRVEGDGNNTINVHNNVLSLSENPKALRATRDVFSPVGQDGFDRVEFKESGKILEKIPPDAAEEILASCVNGIEEVKETKPFDDEFVAWLSVYSPVYDEKVENWRFRMGREVIYADISETSIAEQALESGGAPAHDAYQVRMLMTIEVASSGKEKKPQYKILEVLRFIPSKPTDQGELDLRTPAPKPSKKKSGKRKKAKKKSGKK